MPDTTGTASGASLDDDPLPIPCSSTSRRGAFPARCSGTTTPPCASSTSTRGAAPAAPPLADDSMVSKSTRGLLSAAPHRRRQRLPRHPHRRWRRCSRGTPTGDGGAAPAAPHRRPGSRTPRPSPPSSPLLRSTDGEN
jgi:hypothetical protein